MDNGNLNLKILFGCLNLVKKITEKASIPYITLSVFIVRVDLCVGVVSFFSLPLRNFTKVTAFCFGRNIVSIKYVCVCVKERQSEKE